MFNVGALAVENIYASLGYPLENIANDVNLPLKKHNYVVVTYHPVTQERGTAAEQMAELMSAMEERKDLYYIITKSNADEGGETINRMWDEFGQSRDNCAVVTSLGMRRYLTALSQCLMVLGNSSSGILEAPVCGVPTVNIGDRQKGRVKASTVIDCLPEKSSIIQAMSDAERRVREGIKPDMIFGSGGTSERILEILKNNMKVPIKLKKHFWDLS